ncbi:hypothetical protein O9X90_23335 [Agrobacterium leguminum]|uniref:hypothetical protein n=1 Tax=Agrobacterium leguminum TaxID=2792015 RepID=UPI0022B81240|nr:hypothetical protein [Agrobacterium leguminum]MCZ7935268.1 hypothetical protein [Agrobacterium leguminum]
MNVALLPIMTTDLVTSLEQKVVSVWKTLDAKCGPQISLDELDHLLALFVLGLTEPFIGDDNPRYRLETCQKLLLLTFDDARVQRALCTVPAATQPWVEKAFGQIEQLGMKDGRDLLEQHQKTHQKLSMFELTPGIMRERQYD